MAAFVSSGDAPPDVTLAAAESQRQSATGNDWLVSPWFDAFLIANIGWPVLLLWQLGDGFSGREGLQFWQIYFVTTPHRWITLALVFLDHERFSQRRMAFLAVATLIVIGCLGVRLTTGTLTCLLTIDYLWNAWHFAAQHHGIYRIYQRRSSTAFTGLAVEKWALRLFLLYVIVRVAGATWSYATLERALQTVDWLVLAIPAWLVVRDLSQGRVSWPRTLYLLSMTALYVGVLGAAHFNRPALVLSLTTASALFHATEYLALVSWTVGARHAALDCRLGLLSYVVPRWGLALGCFVLVLGAGGWLLNQHLMKPWLLINVIVAFMHYAFDGMIWRRQGARR
jgi:hypothetical protein